MVDSAIITIVARVAARCFFLPESNITGWSSVIICGCIGGCWSWGASREAEALDCGAEVLGLEKRASGCVVVMELLLKAENWEAL